MTEQTYIITSPEGIHARPAGFLVKKAGEFKSDIQISCKGNSANAARLFALMKLGAKKGDSLTVRAEGPDESAAVEAILTLLKENF